MLGDHLVELYFQSGTEGTESARNANRVQGRFRRANRGSAFAWHFDSNHYTITPGLSPTRKLSQPRPSCAVGFSEKWAERVSFRVRRVRSLWLEELYPIVWVFSRIAGNPRQNRADAFRHTYQWVGVL